MNVKDKIGMTVKDRIGMTVKDMTVKDRYECVGLGGAQAWPSSSRLPR